MSARPLPGETLASRISRERRLGLHGQSCKAQGGLMEGRDALASPQPPDARLLKLTVISSTQSRMRA